MVHYGYDDVSFPIALRKLLDPERFTEGADVLDSMGSNGNEKYMYPSLGPLG